MSFSTRLIEAFDGASMAEIARRLGVPHSTIRNYVQNDRLPSAEVLIEIANRTNVSLNWLLAGTGSKSKEPNGPVEITEVLTGDDIAAIERLRRRWNSERNDSKSLVEFLKVLLYKGEGNLLREDREDEITDDLRTGDFALFREHVLAQSILYLVRDDLIGGDLRDVVVEIVQESLSGVKSVAPEIGAKEAFDIDAAIRRSDDPQFVLEEWYRSEGWPLQELSVPAFSGWEEMTLEEKAAELRSFIAVRRRQIERQNALPPKTP